MSIGSKTQAWKRTFRIYHYQDIRIHSTPLFKKIQEIRSLKCKCYFFFTFRGNQIKLINLHIAYSTEFRSLMVTWVITSILIGSCMSHDTMSWHKLQWCLVTLLIILLLCHFCSSQLLGHFDFWLFRMNYPFSLSSHSSNDKIKYLQ